MIKISLYISLLNDFYEIINEIITNTMSTHKLGNPAVVGLAGFGLTTLLLQLEE